MSLLRPTAGGESCKARIFLEGLCSLTVRFSCYNMDITKEEGDTMWIKIDFQSDEALYIQLRNQIIMGIAASVIQEGDALPSVRQLADDIGINMHTVNKAYAVLRQEGFLTIDRRRGAIIALDVDKFQAMEEMKRDFQIILAKACCKNISLKEVHDMVDEIFEEYNS